MKYHVRHQDPLAWLPALLRRRIDATGQPSRCRIRKCRRDGRCGGPLVRLRDGRLELLADPDGHIAARDRAADDVMTTLCWFSLTADVQARLAEGVRAEIGRLAGEADGRVKEETRTLRARRWRPGRLDEGTDGGTIIVRD